MEGISVGFHNFIDSLSKDPVLFGAVLLMIVNLVLIGYVFLLARRVTTLTKGRNGASLEKTIRELCDAVNELDDWRDSATELFDHFDKRLKGSVRGTSLVRFNPFKGTGSGGNQSFAAAFLDEEGTGVVVSSLYSRERVSLFGKPLSKFNSTFELTSEEKQAVAEAKNKITNK